MSSLQIEDLLGELTREGELQSTGRFSLDVSKAKEKLAQFQFSDPFCYILKLVQAAVVSRADGFILQSGSTELIATMVGVGFDAHSLENLLYCLLQETSETPASPALRHLAVAVNAAVGTRASEIVIKSWDGKTGVQVSWTPTGQRSAPWQPTKPQVQTRFEMRRLAGDVLSDVYQKVASRDILSMFTGSRKGMDREQGLIYDRCAFCPIPIRINGKDCPGYDLGAPAGTTFLNQLLNLFTGGTSLNPKHHLLELYLPCAEETRLGLAPPRLTHTRWAGNLDKNKTYSAILALPARLTGRTQVVPVLDGVDLQVQKLEWPGPPSIFYLDAHGLDLDLTGVSLVQNEKALGRFSELGQQLLEAARQYLTSSVVVNNGLMRQQLKQLIQEGEKPMVFTR